MLLAGGLISGCHWRRQEAPEPRGFDRETTIPAHIDEVWSAVIDVLGERDWPIDHLERASGFVGTDWVTSGWLTPAPHVGYLDCGGALSFGKREDLSAHHGRFNVVLCESVDGVVLKINSTWRAYRDAQWVDCVSTGLIEDELHAEIRARASP